MPVYEGSHETEARSCAEAAFNALTEFERLPEWQRALHRCVVLDRHPDGLGRDVRYEADVRIRRVTYTLRHTYERPNRIFSEYVEGDFRRFEGDWSLTDLDGGRCKARLWLRIDPGLPLPGRIVRMLQGRVLNTAVEELRTHLEDG
jgi:ribosome-associated toxin RatA of RatAB toxin-antitoxin module